MYREGQNIKKKKNYTCASDKFWILSLLTSVALKGCGYLETTDSGDYKPPLPVPTAV